MIAPTNRLIIWVGVVFAPLAALAFTAQYAGILVMSLVAGLFLLVIISDAVISAGRLAGVNVELPDIVRLSKGKKEEIPVRIFNRGNILKNIQIGFSFPFEMLAVEREMVVALPNDSEHSSFAWPCKALKRGRSFLNFCYLRALSPVSLWTCKKRIPVHSEIRVYPDLFSEKKDIAFLFQNRGTGTHSQRLMGKGRDFEQLREYMPGDSFEDIHWKATAKRQYPVTKVFQIERTQEVYFIIDTSRMSNRIIAKDRDNDTSNNDLTVLERYISASLIMALVTEKIGDLFGFVAFSNNIHRFMKAGRGKTHFNNCRDALYTLRSMKTSPDFSELITYISANIRRRSLLIFMTNLEDPVLADDFIEKTGIIAKKHLVMVNMLNPGTVKPVFSSPDAQSTGDVYQNLGRHMIYQNLYGMKKHFEKRGIGFLLMENENLISRLVSQYLGVKQKQQL